MTNRKIDELVGTKVMGWSIKRSKFSRKLRLHNGSFFFANLEDYKFSTNPALIPMLERRMDSLNKSTQYATALCEVVLGPKGCCSTGILFDSVFKVATATPKQRCLAALKALYLV